MVDICWGVSETRNLILKAQGPKIDECRSFEGPPNLIFVYVLHYPFQSSKAPRLRAPGLQAPKLQAPRLQAPRLAGVKLQLTTLPSVHISPHFNPSTLTASIGGFLLSSAASVTAHSRPNKSKKFLGHCIRKYCFLTRNPMVMSTRRGTVKKH